MATMFDSVNPFDNGLPSDYLVQPLAKVEDLRGFMYLVWDSAFPDHIKIGRTVDMYKRLMAYNKDRPYKSVELICISDMFVDIIEVETRILGELYKATAPTTFRKEWFEIKHKQLCLDYIKAAEEHFLLT